MREGSLKLGAVGAWHGLGRHVTSGYSQLGVLCHEQELLAVHLPQRPRVQELQEGLLPLFSHKLLVWCGQVLQDLVVHVGRNLDGGGVPCTLAGQEGEQTPNLSGLQCKTQSPLHPALTPSHPPSPPLTVKVPLSPG